MKPVFHISAPRHLTTSFPSLPAILHTTDQNPVSGYSEGSWGLSVLLRVSGIFTGITTSPRSSLRQRPYRYTIRAGRNLPDKEFRYLRTIRPLAGLQSAMFLLNSRMGPFTAPPDIAPEDPFSLSYGAMLPSSLTRFLSRALVYLHPPTCVGFGTACGSARHVFSRRHGRIALLPCGCLRGPFPAREGITIDPRDCPSANVPF